MRYLTMVRQIWQKRLQGKSWSLPATPRRTLVLGGAVLLVGWSLLGGRHQMQTVVWTEADGSDKATCLVPLESPAVAEIRTWLTKYKETTITEKPDAYYQAKWKCEAAEFYLRQTKPIEEAETTSAVVQATFHETDSSEVDRQREYWQNELATSKLTLQTINSSLQPAPGSSVKVPIQFGAVVSSPLTVTETMTLTAFALLIMAGYYAANRLQSRAVAVSEADPIHVHKSWIKVQRSRKAEMLKRIDQSSWLLILLCVGQSLLR